MADYLSKLFGKETPQSEPILRREQEMVKNSAGGYTFQIDDWMRLERFLILGSEGGSYYASERKLTLENAQCVERCLNLDGPRVVRTIVQISDSGRAPKHGPALFALAMAASFGGDETRTAALAALPQVARIGTHLFHFASFIDGMRGWGRGLRGAIADWYASHPVEKLAYQVTKYQQRDGWSHRDLLRLAHPKADGPRDALYRWVVSGDLGDKRPELIEQTELRLLAGFEAARQATTAGEVAQLIREHGLTREMIPTEHLDSPDVWAALLEKMPLTAMFRNLAVMTRVGLIKPMSEASRLVTNRLQDSQALRKARIHPIAVLTALLTYKAGRGSRGKGKWDPVPQIVDALDGAFYLAFENSPRTGKRFYLGIDVSGSMGTSTVAGVIGLSARVGAAAMAMTVAKVEPQYYMAGFSAGETWNDSLMAPLSISASDSLDTVCRKTSEMPFGGTDCALPMIDALERKIAADVFIVLTDSETWAGKMHPVEALRNYRERTGIPAKLIVVAMVANQFTVADPNDAGMLDVVGFDSATPNLMADFAAH